MIHLAAFSKFLLYIYIHIHHNNSVFLMVSCIQSVPIHVTSDFHVTKFNCVWRENCPVAAQHEQDEAINFFLWFHVMSFWWWKQRNDDGCICEITAWFWALEIIWRDTGLHVFKNELHQFRNWQTPLLYVNIKNIKKTSPQNTTQSHSSTRMQNFSLFLCHSAQLSNYISGGSICRACSTSTVVKLAIINMQR